MVFLYPIDLNRNEILNFVVQNLAVAPSSPVEGLIYGDTTLNTIRYYNGTSWVDLGQVLSDNDIIDKTGSGFSDTNSINLDLTSHIITAALRRKTSGLTSGVQGLLEEDSNGVFVSLGVNANKALPGSIKLNEITTPDGNLSLNSYRIVNLSDPLSSSDAATKNYVDSKLEGLDPKDSVLYSTSGNITLSGLGTQAGGDWATSIPANSRILVKNQTLPEENGIYIATSGSWSRSLDANTWEKLTSAYVFIESGSTLSDSGWTCNIDSGGTLGTTAVNWTKFSNSGEIVAGSGLGKTGNTLDVNVDNSTIEISSDTLRIKDAGVTFSKIQNVSASRIIGRGSASSGSPVELQLGTNLSIVGDVLNATSTSISYSANIGDGIATQFTITHSLGTRDIIVQVYRNSSPYDVVYCSIEKDTINSVVLTFSTPPTSNQYRVVIK